MKRYFSFVAGMGLLALMTSCGDDPLPPATAAFTYNSETDAAPEVGLRIQFNNESTNFAQVRWDFGNGVVTDSLSPSIIYEESGDYIVTLTATTADGQETVTSQDLVVGERIMTALNIFEIEHFKEDGSTWDPVDTTVENSENADLIFFLGPQGTSDPSRIIILNSTLPGAEFLENITPDDLPFGFTLNDQGPSFVLTDELWDLLFLDDDGEDVDPELMLQGTFNPVFLANSFFIDNTTGVLNIDIGGYSLEIGFRIDIPNTQ